MSDGDDLLAWIQLDDLLEQWIEQRRDVSFPIHFEDCPAADAAFVTPFGFSNDARVFRTEWEISISTSSRLTASFTGVLLRSLEEGTDNYYLLLEIVSPQPPAPQGGPSWYPYPNYARYGPFNVREVRGIAEALLTDDEDIVSELLTAPVESEEVRKRLDENNRRLAIAVNAYRSPDGTSVTERSDIVQAFVQGDLKSGIPVPAGEVLCRRDRDFRFSLHPQTFPNAEGALPERDVNLALFFNPNWYFWLWKDCIEPRSGWHPNLTRRALGPPLTSGTVHRVKQTPDPSFTPQPFTTLSEAIEGASEHDTILILDKATYDAGEGIYKYVSVLGLVAPDDDVTRFGDEPLSQLAINLPVTYPTIRSSRRGQRGLNVFYANGRPRRPGLAYIANLCVADNVLDVTQESTNTPAPRFEGGGCGGGGIVVYGERHYRRSGASYVAVGNGFDRCHVHNCAVFNNSMSNLPTEPQVWYGGGGILCFTASPWISNSLLRFNHAFLHGGGIGIFLYSFPVMTSNVIADNESGRHEHTFDPLEPPGGNSDGGGIGVFQAYPEFHVTGYWRQIVEGYMPDVADAWDRAALQRARDEPIHISNNKIRHNKARMSGGGIYATVCARLRVSGSEITDNTASDQSGGGVAVTYGSLASIHACRISGNSARQFGAGIFVRASKMWLSNTEVEENGISEIARSVKGGGIAVLSVAEIATVYAAILEFVFDHIDRVYLHAKDRRGSSRQLTISRNQAQEGGGLYVQRDFPPPTLPVSVELTISSSRMVDNSPENYSVLPGGAPTVREVGTNTVVTFEHGISDF